MSQPNIHRYLRHGTLPQLRLFEATARLGSFTRAAEELHMSQPTASVQIKKLSETLGVPLFEQVGKRIYLTDAGRRLYESCQEVFHAFMTLEDSLAGMRSLDSGRLRLAVSTTGMCFAPRLLGGFVALHPAVETSVQAHNRQTLVRRLAGNEDDLYLFADAPDLEDVVAQELLPNPLVVLARDDHPLANAKGIAFERLAREPFLMREEGSGARRIAMRLFGQRGLTPKIRMELGTNEAIKEAILAGLGITIMSRYTFGLDPESSRYACLDVEGFPLENHWYLVYPGGKQLTAVARAFLDFARANAKALVRESFAGRVAATSGAAAGRSSSFPTSW
jgi:DNA-binding transcriptional LysR family regulator